MRGLLYKDLYLIRNKLLIGMWIIFAIAVFAVIAVLGMTRGNFKSVSEETDIFNLFFKGLLFLVAGTGLYTALNSASVIDMDDRCEWFKVLYASPVTVVQELLSRYLLAFIVNTVMTVWIAMIIPFIYFAGGQRYGLEEMKLIGCCWLFGILLIFVRLPVDIVFPAKISTAVSVGMFSAVLIGLLVGIGVAGDTAVFDCIVGAVRFVYKYGAVFVVGAIACSFSVSYLGVRNRRWG